MSFLLSVLLLVLQAAPAVSGSPSVPGPALTYRFTNDAFVVSRVVMTLDPSGAGTLTYTSKGIANPINRTFSVGHATLEEAARLVARLDGLRSAASYQSKRDHANLGSISLSLEQPSGAVETTFNYTDDPDMRSLQALLQGLVTREIHTFDLETAASYSPLSVPSVLRGLGEDIGYGRVTDPEALLPMLHGMSENVAVPLIARNDAAKLAARIERGGKKH